MKAEDMAECERLEKEAMLHDASEGRYPDAFLRSRSDGTFQVADNLLKGSVSVFVWVTKRPNETMIERHVFSRRPQDACRPDHMCVTLIAEDGWRYSLGLVYSGKAHEHAHPIARLLLDPLNRVPAAKGLVSNLDIHTSKAITPDWPLAEALNGELALLAGRQPDRRKPTGFELVAIGQLSSNGRRFLEELARNSKIERKGNGYDIFNEAVLGRFRKLTQVREGRAALHNCASFVELFLPELVDCTGRGFLFNRFLGYRLPLYCRSKQTAHVTCTKRNASHTSVVVEEAPRAELEVAAGRGQKRGPAQHDEERGLALEKRRRK